MKPPGNKNGDPVAEAAAGMSRAKTKPDCFLEIVNRLRQRARFYFNRYQRTNDPLDIRRATMAQLDVVGLLEERRP